MSAATSSTEAIKPSGLFSANHCKAFLWTGLDGTPGIYGDNKRMAISAMFCVGTNEFVGNIVGMLDGGVIEGSAVGSVVEIVVGVDVGIDVVVGLGCIVGPDEAIMDVVAFWYKLNDGLKVLT